MNNKLSKLFCCHFNLFRFRKKRKKHLDNYYNNHYHIYSQRLSDNQNIEIISI